MYCSSIFSRVYYVFLLDPPGLQDISHWSCRVPFVWYPLQGDPRFQLVCTPLSRAPSWFPLVPSENGIWASPPETDQDSCPGWQPLYLVSLQEGFSPGPLTPRFKRFPVASIFRISFLCVFFVIHSVEPLCETIHRLEDFINDLPNP